MLNAEQLQQLRDADKIDDATLEKQKKRLADKVLHGLPAPKQKNGVIYVVLAFFLGTTGLHNFYAGYWGRGLAQLCLTLIAPWFLYIPLLFVSVWVLLELLFVSKSAHEIPFGGSRKTIIILRSAAILLLAFSFSYSSLITEEADFTPFIEQL